MRQNISILVTIIGIWSTSIQAQTLNTQGASTQAMDGESQLSCAAILCLASAVRPTQCMSPVMHYFSIVRWRFWETLQARLDFLNLCPVNGVSGMDTMKSALVRGAGRCDAASLNVESYVDQDRASGGYVSNGLPDYCSAYFGNDYVRVDAPRYVGTPARGGYWAEARDYGVALAAYTQKLAEMDSGRGQSRGTTD
jgi:hypothetical protein